jgi:hypothetical protein
VAQAEPGETPAVIFAAIDARLRADPARAVGRSAAYAFDIVGDIGLAVDLGAVFADDSPPGNVG